MMTPESALLFFASVIKSGESWSPQCQQALDEARAHLAQQPDLTAIREVIADMRMAKSPYCQAWADKLASAIGDKP